MLNRNSFLGFFDIAKGTRVKKYYDFFKSTLTWSRNEIENYQLQKMKELITFAYNRTDFYRRRFEELNLTPDSIKSLEEVKKIPVLTRSDIQNNFDNLIASAKLNKKYFKSSSSGTTGIPVNYIHDIEGESAGIAAGLVCWRRSGWDFKHKGLHIWGNPVSIKHWKKISSRIKRYIFNMRYLASPLLNDLANYPNIIEGIKKYKPDYIEGYTSSIFSLALYIKDHNISIPRCKFVFTTAENLLEYQEKIIEESLGPVSDCYGFGEINGVAVRPVDSDNYFIFEPHALVDVEEGPVDGCKEIVVTDLDNKVMPFIRYKVGDLIDNIFEYNAKAKYHFKSFKKILGRTAEAIELKNGKKILPVNLLGGTFIREFKSINHHKVVWNGNYLEFIFESSHQLDQKLLEKKISEILFDYDVDYKILFVDKILPDESGKFKYVEINIK